MKKVILLFVLPLMCLTLFPNISGAIGFEGIGGKLDLVLPNVGNNTIGFGAIASLGPIVPQMNALKAEVGAEYWGNSQDVNVFGSKISSSSSIISFNGTAKYYFTNVGMQPFAGAGLGLVRSSGSTKSVYGGDFNTSSTDLGIHLLGGVEFPIGTNMKFDAEARYVSANGHWFQISGGIMLKLD